MPPPEPALRDMLASLGVGPGGGGEGSEAAAAGGGDRLTGCRVELRGLAARPALNGARGVAGGMGPHGRRWVVMEQPCALRVVAARDANLSAVARPPGAAREADVAALRAALRRAAQAGDAREVSAVANVARHVLDRVSADGDTAANRPTLVAAEALASEALAHWGDAGGLGDALRSSKAQEHLLIKGHRMSILHLLGRLTEAEAASREDIAHARESRDENSLAMMLHSRATALTNRGEYAKAEPLVKEAMELYKRAAERDKAYRHHYLALKDNYATVLQRQGREDEAEPLFREVLRVHRAQLGKAHLTTIGAMNNLALCVKDRAMHRILFLKDRLNSAAQPPPGMEAYLEMITEARRIFMEATRLLEANHPLDGHTASIAANLAGSLASCTADGDEVTRCLRKALAISREHLGPGHSATQAYQGKLANLLLRGGDKAGARAVRKGKDAEAAAGGSAAARECAWCHKTDADSAKFKVCTRCRISAYCSAKCQRQHWKAAHKHECVEWGSGDGVGKLTGARSA